MDTTRWTYSRYTNRHTCDKETILEEKRPEREWKIKPSKIVQSNFNLFGNKFPKWTVRLLLLCMVNFIQEEICITKPQKLRTGCSHFSYFIIPIILIVIELESV